MKRDLRERPSYNTPAIPSCCPKLSVHGARKNYKTSESRNQNKNETKQQLQECQRSHHETILRLFGTWHFGGPTRRHVSVERLHKQRKPHVGRVSRLYSKRKICWQLMTSTWSRKLWNSPKRWTPGVHLDHAVCSLKKKEQQRNNEKENVAIEKGH